MKLRLLLPLVATAALMAQPPGMMTPPAPAELKAYLGLTDQQVTQLQALRTEEFQARRTLAQQVGAKQQALHEALKAGGATATALGQLLLDIQALRSQLDAIEAKYQTQAKGLLNADQTGKLGGLVEARKLAPAIRQAEGLNLLEGPVDGPGLPGGHGRDFPRGPGHHGGRFRGPAL